MTPKAHTIRVPASMASWMLRLLLVLVGGGSAVLLNPYPLWQGIGVIAAAVGAAFPRTFAAWGSVASIVLGILLAEPAPIRTAAAVLAIHLVHVLAGLCATTPLRGRVALSALRPTLLRLLLIQAIAQPIALLAAVLPKAQEHGSAWLAPAGALLVVAVVVIVLRVEKREERPSRNEAADPSVRGPS